LPATESDGIGSIIVTGGVKGRQMFLSSFTEKLADPMNALPTFFATAITEALYGLENRFRFIADKVVIDIDDQHCWPLSETGALAIAGKSKNVLVTWC
jgi:hypothetical protein